MLRKEDLPAQQWPSLEEVEKCYINKVLEATGGNKRRTVEYWESPAGRYIVAWKTMKSKHLPSACSANLSIKAFYINKLFTLLRPHLATHW